MKMMESIVLVGPKYGGNVGAVARCAKNFGLSDLVLAGSAPLGDEARKAAMHAQDVLAHARIVGGLEEALGGMDYVVGTTSVRTISKGHYIRAAITPKELAHRLNGVDGRIALLFGREDYGLSDEELERCDVVCRIPTAQGCPVMNLSHAAAIILYELHGLSETGIEMASVHEKDLMYERVGALLRAIKYHKHKTDNTLLMIKRLVGRAVLTEGEYHTLMGLLSRILSSVR